MTEQSKKRISKLLRDDYSIGGNFHDDRQGLCFTYEQLELKEKQLETLLQESRTATLKECIEIGESLQEEMPAPKDKYTEAEALVERHNNTHNQAISNYQEQLKKLL